LSRVLQSTIIRFGKDLLTYDTIGHISIYTLSLLSLLSPSFTQQTLSTPSTLQDDSLVSFLKKDVVYLRFFDKNISSQYNPPLFVPDTGLRRRETPQTDYLEANGAG